MFKLYVGDYKIVDCCKILIFIMLNLYILLYGFYEFRGWLYLC